jgi:hypothetical protein
VKTFLALAHNKNSFSGDPVGLHGEGNVIYMAVPNERGNYWLLEPYNLALQGVFHVRQPEIQ